MTDECLVCHDPVGVAQELECVRAHAGAREDEIRVHGDQGLTSQPKFTREYLALRNR